MITAFAAEAADRVRGGVVHLRMGDASGGARNFEECSTDIAVAIDTLFAQSPATKRVVLWGLCDAASAALIYLQERHDARVAGLILLNPWVRSAETLSKTHLKHYYGKRLLERTRSRKTASATSSAS